LFRQEKRFKVNFVIKLSTHTFLGKNKKQVPMKNKGIFIELHSFIKTSFTSFKKHKAAMKRLLLTFKKVLLLFNEKYKEVCYFPAQITKTPTNTARKP